MGWGAGVPLCSHHPPHGDYSHQFPSAVSINNMIPGFRNISWFPRLSGFSFGSHYSTPTINAIKRHQQQVICFGSRWAWNYIFSSTTSDWYPDWYLLRLYRCLIAFNPMAQPSLLLANQKHYSSTLVFWGKKRKLQTLIKHSVNQGEADPFARQ